MPETEIQTLNVRLTLLEDREAIRTVLHKYTRAVDRCDLTLLKSCYWPDGFDDHGFYGGNAHEFCDYVIPVLKRANSSIHQISNEIIELDGDKAFVECQWQVLHRLASGNDFLDFMHQGRYIDVFEKRDGEWRIHTRMTTFDSDRMFKVPDFRGLAVEAFKALGRDEPPFDPFQEGKRAPDDAVYKSYDFVNYIDKNRIPSEDIWKICRDTAPLLLSPFLQRLLRTWNRLPDRK